MKIDRVGQRFGALTVVAHSHSVFRSSRHGSYQFWRCRCDCGVESVVLASNLTKGNTTSCGCRSSRLTLGDRNTTHGMSETATYGGWSAMRDRCSQRTHSEWPRYGGRGVSVCERWDSFENFLQDMGERPSAAHSIDRWPNRSGNYEPGNCRWATHQQQARNKSNTVLIEFRGEALTAAEWSERTGLGADLIAQRIRNGWEPGRAMSAPSRAPKPRATAVRPGIGGRA